MALGDPYIELEDLKDYLKIPLDKLSLDDALDDALRSASEEIERHCNRQFNQVTSVSARRYQPSKCGTKVLVDDFYSTTGLVVEYDNTGLGDWVTLTLDTDYEVRPLNGVVDGQSGWPYYEILFFEGVPVHKIDRRNYKSSVRVTAKWGWTAVPRPVSQACRIIAAETFQLKDAPFGVAGSDQFGNVLRVRDNRIAAGKLARYVRNRIPGG